MLAPESSRAMKWGLSLDESSTCARWTLRTFRIVSYRNLFNPRQATCTTLLTDSAVQCSFQEENVAHMRFLHDTSYGMDSSISFSYTGMSLMYSSMSLPYSGMSLTMKVETEPSDDIVKLLTDGDVVIADIIPESEHQSNVIDVPVGLPTSTGESQELPQESFDSTYRTVFIAVMATLVVLALAMIAIVVYRKKRATRVISNCEDRSKCETSTVSGVDINAQETKGSAV